MEAAALKTGRSRSDLLAEACAHWLLLYKHKLEAPRIVETLDEYDRLGAAVDAAEAALEKIQEVRAHLILRHYFEQPEDEDED